MNQVIHCRICKQPKGFDEIVKNRINKKSQTGDCKKCHSKRVTYSMTLRHAKIRPHKYMECDSCDHLFLKFSKGNRVHGFYTPITKTNCPKCESKNIINFDNFEIATL